MEAPPSAPAIPPDTTDAARDVIGWTAVGVGAVGALAVFSQRILEIGPQQCSLRVLAGVPCPVCGLSTTALGMVRGDVVDTLGRDGIGVAFLGVVSLLAVLQLGRAAGIGLWRPRAQVAAITAASLLLTHWMATLTGVVALAPLT